MKRTNDKTLIAAMRILSRDIESGDGVANAAIAEAADRLEELTTRRPRFGEWMRGIHAGLNNPIRDGMYVETITRTGRMNPGKFYRLTDGKGRFWEYPTDAVAFMPTASEGGEG